MTASETRQCPDSQRHHDPYGYGIVIARTSRELRTRFLMRDERNGAIRLSSRSQ